LAFEFDRRSNGRREVMIEQLPHFAAQEIPFAVGHAATDREVVVDPIKTEIMPPGKAHRFDDRLAR
jgi:hypothetical protein